MNAQAPAVSVRSLTRVFEPRVRRGLRRLLLPRQVRRNIGVLLVMALVYGSAALVLLRVTDAAARARGELDWM